MSRSMKFGGTLDDPFGSDMVYLGDPETYGLTVLLDRMQLVAMLGVDIQTVPYGFGGVSWGPHFEPKIIPVPCAIEGDDWEDIQTKFQNLNFLLNKNRLAALWFDDMPTMFWMVRLSGSEPTRVGSRGAPFTLVFTATDPRAYGVDVVTQTVNLSTGTNAFNVPESGTLGGNIECTPTYIIKPSGSGASNMTLGHAARAESLTYANAVASTEWLRIDTTLREQVDKSTDSGASYAPSMTGVTGLFPKLSPRIANSMTLTGITSTGTLEISYRERYI